MFWCYTCERVVSQLFDTQNGPMLLGTSTRPNHTQTSPVETQKSPIDTQKSTIHTQKSPRYTQKSPIDSQKSPRDSQNGTMFPDTQYIDIWVMYYEKIPESWVMSYVWMRHITCRHSIYWRHSKEPYTHSKEPYTHSKEPYTHSKEPRIHSKSSVYKNTWVIEWCHKDECVI